MSLHASAEFVQASTEIDNHRPDSTFGPLCRVDPARTGVAVRSGRLSPTSYPAVDSTLIAKMPSVGGGVSCSWASQIRQQEPFL